MSTPRDNRLKCRFCSERYNRIEDRDLHEAVHHGNGREANQSTEHAANTHVAQGYFINQYGEMSDDLPSFGKSAVPSSEARGNIIVPQTLEEQVELMFRSPKFPDPKQLEFALGVGHRLEYNKPNEVWTYVPGPRPKPSPMPDFHFDFNDLEKSWGMPDSQEPSSSGKGKAGASTSSSKA
ncbi:uncharacterized protein EV420DRAFT_1083642 [Desarmillaria tabescens]|uniref:C2H2-type domain-containing protein n=1 Tax=Armillaria tabescens TaxID=1929756 RepID=A0AA39JIN5_ARMTA|nr:uncharacterized protein EV420DRAFT_1083642 [Desarmillaria tabescens]KAK0442029.1 hypothetical protein EV420DRAFT_1083642 [Desarmillaria tabescens]